jgi:hypothetical protein
MPRHVGDDGSFPRKQPCPASAGQRSGVLLSGDAQSASPSRMLQARSGKIISAARRVGRMCQSGCAMRDAIDFKQRGRYTPSRTPRRIPISATAANPARDGLPDFKRTSPFENEAPPSALGEGLPGATAGRRHAGAPARLRGLVPAWRLARPRHRGQFGREIPFSRSPQAAMIAG